MIWDPFERMLWGAAFCLTFIGAILYLNLGRKIESREDKITLNSFGTSLLFQGIGFTIAVLSDIYVHGFFQNYVFIGDFSTNVSLYRTIDKIGVFITYIGCFLIIFSFELRFKNTKYIFSIISLVSFIPLLFIPTWELYDAYIAFPSMYHTIMIILILITYARWSQTELKAVSSILLFGYMLTMICVFMNNQMVRKLNIFPLALYPILWIIGTLFVMSPALIKPEHYSKAKKYWIRLGVIITSFGWVLFFYVHAVGYYLLHPINHYSILMLLILYTLLLLFMNKILNPKQKEQINDKPANILSAFTPQVISLKKKLAFQRRKRRAWSAKERAFASRISVRPAIPSIA